MKIRKSYLNYANISFLLFEIDLNRSCKIGKVDVHIKVGKCHSVSRRLNFVNSQILNWTQIKF